MCVRYGVVIERGDRNCSAYVPDLPGCVATGETVEETKSRIRQAIELHLKGMREDGDVIPEPRTVCDNVEVA
jgi:predicted RNase H-like HicB family nuclease